MAFRNGNKWSNQLEQDAQQRAAMAQQPVQVGGDVRVRTPSTRFGHAIRTPRLGASPPTPNGRSPSNSQEMTTPEEARSQWRKHGSAGLSQASEERRKPLHNMDTVVRIVGAEPRCDVSGASFTAYLVSVKKQTVDVVVERRYSEFRKLDALLRESSIPVAAVFPSPTWWSARLGKFTPSVQMAPEQHDNLVAYRRKALDVWLVDVVVLYNRNRLTSPVVHQAVHDFLHAQPKAPCDCDNPVQSRSMEETLKLSNPFSFSLGSAIRQATQMVEEMCLRPKKLSSLGDENIPLDLLQHAKGLCFLTIFKAGLVVSGKVGTGLVVQRRHNGEWSAPSAVGMLGLGYGAQVGGDLTHCMLVLTSETAVDAFWKNENGNLTLGAEVGVAVGPVGRGGTTQVSTGTPLRPAYAFCHSKGLFLGLSLEGSVLTNRNDVNSKFYGRAVDIHEILQYHPPPRAAGPLYDVLRRACEKEIREDAFRPTQLWNASSSGRSSRAPASPHVGTIRSPPPLDVVTIDRIASSGRSSLFDTSPGTQ